jgi:hypothetical protein
MGGYRENSMKRKKIFFITISSVFVCGLIGLLIGCNVGLTVGDIDIGDNNGTLPKKPNLVPTVVSASTRGDSGAENKFSIAAVLDNNGEGDATGVSIGFYISEDAIYNGGTDILIATSDNINIKAGSVTIVSRQITLPAISTPPYTYYVIAYADPGDTIDETNETDNIVSMGNISINSLFTDDPDLAVYTFDTYDQHLFSTGESLDYVFNVINNSLQDIAVDFAADLWLSTNPWTWVDGWTIHGLDANKYISLMPVTVPTVPAVAPGVYNLIYEIDSDEVITEADETNNTIIWPIRIL